MNRFSLFLAAAVLTFAPLANHAEPITHQPPTAPGIPAASASLSASSANDPAALASFTGNCSVAGNCATGALAAFAGNPFTFAFASPSTVSFYAPAYSEPSTETPVPAEAGGALRHKRSNPDPASLLLMAVGALTTAWMLRRRIDAPAEETSQLPNALPTSA